MKDNILCTICARGGSKGVHNKNLKLINGKPLIAYTIEAAKESGLFSRIVVSTDSDEIIKVAKEYGADVFFKRPAELASDKAAKIPVIRHAHIESTKHFKEEYNIHVDLDATSPLRLVSDLTEALDQFKKNDNDILITAMEARRSPYFNLIEDFDGKIRVSKELPQQVIRRQDSPKCYDMNASIYIWKSDVLMESDTVFMDKTGLYVMPEERSYDIDTELDFKIVEMILKERNNSKEI